ncbi:MAG: hypothetical protein JST80_12360 [Bdellovibrionales bacterium]|nr:hypothetical protein [Bdellovibrionales bacterium]
MKTFAILISLFTTTSSFALNNEWNCLTKKFGPDHRQISVALNADETSNITAVVLTTSTVGRYEPIFFTNLRAYGLNGAVSYLSPMSSYKFNLTIRTSNYTGTLYLGNATYPVSCAKAKSPIAI